MGRHPPEVRCEGVRGLLNFVGCALGGARDEAMDIAVTVLAPFFGAPQAIVIGRRLGRLICCSRELPRCGLFCLSGAELLRRDSGRIGGFEKGEFERDSARKEVAA